MKTSICALVAVGLATSGGVQAKGGFSPQRRDGLRPHPLSFTATGLYRSEHRVSAARSGGEIVDVDRLGLEVRVPLVLSGVDPIAITCPVSNCPTSPPVRSALNVFGQTRQGAGTPEWESVIGLISATGDPNGQKVVQYLGGMQAPGAGSMWTLNTDVVRNATPGGAYSFNGLPGSGVQGRPNGIGRSDATVGYELDLTNWSEDDAPGGPFVVGMFISTLSTYSSLSGIYYGAAKGQRVPSWHDGIFFSKNTIKDNSVFDASDASFSYQVSGSHIAAFYDNSFSHTGLSINGHHSEQDVLISDNAPVGVSIRGTHSIAAITIPQNQKICFDVAGSCIMYNTTKKKWILSNSQGVNVASIDDSGNLRVRGSVREDADP